MLFSKAFNFKLYFVNPPFAFAQGDCQTERPRSFGGSLYLLATQQ
jgi:hypothetical protein